MASHPLDPKIAGTSSGGRASRLKSIFNWNPWWDGGFLAQFRDQGSDSTWYMQRYCLRRSPASISCSSSSEHDRCCNRAGTYAPQLGQVAVPVLQTTAEREGPRHPPLWLQPRARLRWTERSQWLFLALPAALLVALALALRWPMRCTALCTALRSPPPLPSIQTQHHPVARFSLPHSSPSQPSHFALRRSVRAIPPVGRGRVSVDWNCDRMYRIVKSLSPP